MSDQENKEFKEVKVATAISDLVIPKFITKIYIPHYTKNLDRRKYLDEYFNKHSITNFEYRTNDREMTEIINEKIEKYKYKPYNHTVFFPGFRGVINAGQKIPLYHIADAITQIEIFEEIAGNNLNDNSLYLILEDDAIFCENFIEQLSAYLQEVPDDFDIGYIVDGCNLHVDWEEIKRDKIWYLQKDGRSRTCCGYIVTKQFCKTLVKSYTGFGCSIDWWLTYMCNLLGSKVYWCEPVLIREGSAIGTYESAGK